MNSTQLLNTKKMRIVFDMQGLQNESRFRGIGRYTNDFVKQFITLAHQRGYEIILALNSVFSESLTSIRDEYNQLLKQSNIIVWDGLTDIEFFDSTNDERRKCSEAIREAFFESLNADFIVLSELFSGAGDNSTTSISSKQAKTPTAVIFYDLIPLAYENEYLNNPQIKKWYFEKLVHLQNATLLWAISEFTKNEGLEKLRVAKGCIINISSASNLQPSKKSSDENFLRKHNIKSGFLLYCGGSDPRKNLSRLIYAYGKLSPATRKKSQLILAGKMPEQNVVELLELAKSLQLNSDEIIFTGYLSDDNLFGLYKDALGFVFPSYCEGFGLPALEAMLLNLPVIGSNNSSIPEVLGNPNALFNPYSINEISNLMSKLIEDNEFRNQLTEHAKTQRLLFSWEKTASIALNSIETYLNENTIRVAKDNASNIISLEDELVAKVKGILKPRKSTEAELIKIANAINTALPRQELKKYLYVDISELHERDSKSGVQRVVRSIIKNLLTVELINYTIMPVYSTMAHEYRLASRWKARFFNQNDSALEDTAIDPRAGDIFLGLDLQHYITLKNEDFLIWLRQRGVKVKFVVYDLLPVLMPQAFVPEMEAAHNSWLHVLAKMDGIIAISRSVADEMMDWMAQQKISRTQPFQIDWFHLGADIADSEPTTGVPENASEVLAQLSQRPTFLMVGTIEPRKGQNQTLEAFNCLWQEGFDINLVMIGKQGWHVEKLIQDISKHKELDNRLFWLNGVSDEYLEKVYAQSSCLIAASEGEGFGLPLIEAAQYKLPIIARDIPVFKEVAGEHAYYFNGLQPKELAESIKSWLILREKNLAPRSDDMPWLTWKQSADNLLKLCSN